MGASIEPTLPDTGQREPERRQLGRYKVVGTLGSGGMGVVLAARDPDLDRAVALKVLHPSTRGLVDDAARMTREARTMAKLAHPNVVTVYEVGTVDDRLFLAMELVDGDTLRGWLAERPRTWREVVTTYIGAGRGLAAAHAHGVVHRDFKPDNVLIGRDGRPRVSDFGLAADVGDGDRAPGVGAGASSSASTVVGTPAYMAPEQWDGQPADPRSDQFAFCVALWEGLHGERPFVDDDAHATARGHRDLRPPRARVPRWLDAAVRRGLASDPAARWPDLSALLDHLARRTRRRARAIVRLGLAGAAIAVLAVVAARALGPGNTTCDVAGADRAFGPAQRAGLQVGLSAAGANPAFVARVASALDAWRERWKTAKTSACREEGAVAARRQACLERARSHLGLLGEQLARATGPAAASALRAAVALPSPEACLGARIAEAVEVPADPVVATIVHDLDAARIWGRAQPAEAREASARALAAARAQGHPALVAEALLLEALFAYRRDRGARRAQLAEALQHANQSKDRHLQAEITLALFEQATHDQSPEALAAMLPIAHAAATDSDDATLRRSFAVYEARALSVLHRPDEALAACARVAELEPAPQADAEACRCQAYSHALQLPESERSCLAAVEASVARYGDDASYAERSNYAVALSRLGKYRDALVERQRATAIAARVYGPGSSEIAGEHDSMAALYLNMGDPARARPEVEAAIAIWSKLPSPPARDMVNARTRLAEVRGLLGDPAGGADEADRALAEAEAAFGARSPELAVHLLKHGEANLRAARHAVALASLARSAEIAETAYGATHFVLGLALSLRASALLALGRPREALAPAERAASILAATPSDGDNLAEAHTIWGRALVATSDRARARAHFVTARDLIAKLEGQAARLAAVERLLAETR